MDEPQLSLVIPAYEEERRLGRSLEKVFEYLSGRGSSFEVIVVDDGSEDGTSGVVRSFRPSSAVDAKLRLLRNEENRGKGYSVRRGMLAARGRFALLTDADLSTPIEELPKVEAPVRSGGFEIAFGSRDLPASRVELHQPWMRESAGKLFNRLVRLYTGLPFRDTQCGFKYFDLKSCRRIFEKQTLEGFVFDVEILFIARRLELRMVEVPIVWRHAEGSRVSLSGHFRETALDLIKIRLNNSRGMYL